MAKKKVVIRNGSFDGAGLTKDFKQAIIEYILNSFEANANNVRIIAEPYSDEMNHLVKLQIVDDGSGICYETVDDTFGTLLVSQKEKNVFFDRTNKGKGRYVFYNFANSAKWNTVYEKDGKNYSYNITINNDEKDYCNYSDIVESQENTGTSVEFSGITKLKIEDIEGDDLKNSKFNIHILQIHKLKHV